MRLLLSLKETGEKEYPDKHDIQAVLYTALGSSEFGKSHDSAGFKYFTYSDFFYDRHNQGTIIVSSPYPRLIDLILNWAKEQDCIRFSSRIFEIKRIRVIKPRLTKVYTSGSPILLYLDSTTGEYFSFRRHGDIAFFLDRLKDNALKKYEFYSGIKLDLEEPLFDAVDFKREVAVPVKIRGQELTFIGSMWNSLEKDNIDEYEDLYYFLMETGLGEKNSLGFGFINPVGGNGK